MTNAYPVHFSVEPAPRIARLGLLIRFVAFCALGLVGLSIGTVFVFGFVGLPVLAAVRGDRDAKRIRGALAWFSAICAWAGLVTERLPGASPDETVHLSIEQGAARPPTGAAIWRVLSGLPSALALAFFCWIGMFVWLWAVLSVLVHERIGAGAREYLTGLQRWSVRLLAWQASLVDEYPPFSLHEDVGAASTMPPLAGSHP